MAWLPPFLCPYDVKIQKTCPTSAEAAKVQAENLALGRQFGLFLLSDLASAHKTLALLCGGLCKKDYGLGKLL